MTKLDLNKLRSMIRNEVMSIVDEDMLLDKPGPGEPHYIRQPLDVDIAGVDYEEEDEDEWNSMDNYHDDYDEPMSTGSCGDNSMQLMNEDCGCGGKESKEDDYSLDTMRRNPRPDRDFSRLRAPDDHFKDKYEVYWDNPEYGHAAIEDISDMDPDTAFALGKNMGSSGDFDDDHHRTSYMARPQLLKIAKYAGKLFTMIDENEELMDWQESHIAQMADDIAEVYHSIEYKQYKDRKHRR